MKKSCQQVKLARTTNISVQEIGSGVYFGLQRFLGDGEMEDSVVGDETTDLDSHNEPKGEKSHLIVWQVCTG